MTASARPAPTSHAEVNELVRRIRREKKCECPDIDPDGPGRAARVVMVLLTPGPADGGARMTNVLSPTKNWDQTALNLRAMMAEAELPEDICVFWNAVPWSLERRRDPTEAEMIDGAAYLRDFLALIREPRAVVAFSQVTHKVCRMAAVDAIEVPSPSPLAVARPGPRPSRKGERWEEVVEGLRRANALARGRSSA